MPYTCTSAQKHICRSNCSQMGCKWHEVRPKKKFTAPDSTVGGTSALGAVNPGLIPGRGTPNVLKGRSLHTHALYGTCELGDIQISLKYRMHTLNTYNFKCYRIKQCQSGFQILTIFFIIFFLHRKRLSIYGLAFHALITRWPIILFLLV